RRAEPPSLQDYRPPRCVESHRAAGARCASQVGRRGRLQSPQPSPLHPPKVAPDTAPLHLRLPPGVAPDAAPLVAALIAPPPGCVSIATTLGLPGDGGPRG